MAIALVGTAGTASQSAAGVALTPAWGTGESRTAGNLLICLCTAQSTGGGSPLTPSGWTTARQTSASGTNCDIWYKVAAGSDAAPTIAAVSGTTITAAQLLEFSGSANTIDQSNAASSVSSPLVAGTGSLDTQPGDLVVYSFAIDYSTAATKTFTDTMNNGQTAHVSDNAGTSTISHYHFVWAITTSNAAADQDSLAVTTTKLTQIVCVVTSFNPFTAPPVNINMAPYVPY